MVIVTGSTSPNASVRRPLRVLGIFAHPDDETVCAGGTLAKYASAGAEVRVISLTKGGAGQIRDASAATRATLTAVREKELDAAGVELGLTEADVWTIAMASSPTSTVDPGRTRRGAAPRDRTRRRDHVRTRRILGSSRSHRRGGRGHRGLLEMRSAQPIRLFHCHLPRSRMLLRNRLAEWVVELATRFKGTEEFVRALWVFSRETTALGYAGDFVNVEWFPTGSYLIEQGEAASTMYFLLSGTGGDPAGGRGRWGAGGRPVGPGGVHRRSGYRHGTAAQRTRRRRRRRHEPDFLGGRGRPR